MVIERIDDFRWRLPRHGGMRVDGKIFASAALFDAIKDDPCLGQVRNVAHLPGIVGESLAMPDIHWGYGFPIGGVAAFDVDEGVVSPGGVGYDINCGVRLLTTDLRAKDVTRHLTRLATELFQAVPAGVGRKRDDLRLSQKDIRSVAESGAAFAVSRGLGTAGDLEHTESAGRIKGGRLDHVSARAIERAANQLGTLGAGNHFIEIQRVHRIHEEHVAAAFGLAIDQIVITIHTGSRGFGYQICTDHIRALDQATRRYGIKLPDRQLVSAPIDSHEGRAYLSAMAAAANFGFANRQVISHDVRQVFGSVFGPMTKARLLYDVAHNIAKLETHDIQGRPRRLCVHRKGATRAFGPGHPEIPAAYRNVGQPVFIPGDMGRRSFVLAGRAGALEESFGSCCHGAGRVMSRKRALRARRGEDLLRELAKKGIKVMSAGRRTLAEEAPEAYKDVREVVDTVHNAGLAVRVAELKPLVVLKG